jgi:hypothetical protein
MRTNKLTVLIGMLIATIAFTLTFGVLGHADEYDQSTTMTFSAPIQIPGNKVLPSGTYLFKLADSGAERNVAQIFNSEGTQLYATVLAIPTDRQEPTDNTEVTVAELGPGRPDAFLTWFYPGRLTGHEFIYSRHEAQVLAQDRRQTIAVNPQAATDSGTGLGFGLSLFLVSAGL